MKCSGKSSYPEDTYDSAWHDDDDNAGVWVAGWVDAERRVVYAHSFPIFLMIAVKMLNFLFYNFTLRDDDEEKGEE